MPKIPIGISACLLGENVRYDGSHKHNAYIAGTLARHFQLIPFCPEVAIGLGVPRQPIQLVQTEKEIRVFGVNDRSLDVTDDLRKYADQQRDAHGILCGFILKANSPSCGKEKVKLLNGDYTQRNGVGIFAQRLMENLPLLPVVEEGRLENVNIRKNFLQQVFALYRWRSLNKEPITVNRFMSFHSRYEQLIRSRNDGASRVLGKLAANVNKNNIHRIADDYMTFFMATLKDSTRPKEAVNTLR